MYIGVVRARARARATCTGMAVGDRRARECARLARLNGRDVDAMSRAEFESELARRPIRLNFARQGDDAEASGEEPDAGQATRTAHPPLRPVSGCIASKSAPLPQGPPSTALGLVADSPPQLQATASGWRRSSMLPLRNRPNLDEVGLSLAEQMA